MKKKWIAAAAGAAFGSLALLGAAGPAVSADRPATAAQAAADEAPLQLPQLRLDFSAQGLVLSGIVPSRSERDAIVARARRLYGADRVADRVEIGAVANPNWLHAAYLPDLRGASAATALLADATLAIDGSVDAGHAASISASTLPAREAGLKVLNRLRVQR